MKLGRWLGLLAVGSGACAAGVACTSFAATADADASSEDGGANVDGAVDDGGASDADAARDGSDDAPVDGEALPGCALESPFGDAAPLVAANSGDNETGIVSTADQLTLFVASDRGHPGRSTLYRMKRGSLQDDLSIGAINVSVGPDIDDRSPTANADPSNLYFARRPVDGGASAVWISSRPTSGADFLVAAPANLGPASVGATSPSLSASARELFYVQGGNAWRARGSSAHVFAEAAQVALQLPAGSRTTSVVLSTDERTLYLGVMVGDTSDVFAISRASANENFVGNPAPVDSLNSKFSDAPGWISTDNCSMYFVSDRPGGKGGFDIWVAQRGR